MIINKITLLFLSILLMSSCKDEKSKADFIGNWSTTSDTNFFIDIEYYSDSIVVDNAIFFNTYSLNWNVKGNKTHQTLLRNNGSLQNVKSTLDFKFSKNKDTLFLKHEGDSIFNIKLRKIRNSFEYLENRIGLQLNLPKSTEKLTQIDNKELTFNIYLGKKKDSIIVRTDNSLKSISEVIYSKAFFKYTQIEKKTDPKKLEPKFIFNIDTLDITIFTDKSIKNKELDSIKNLFKESSIKRFFRVYASDKYKKEDWKAEINWLGKYETITEHSKH